VLKIIRVMSLQIDEDTLLKFALTILQLDELRACGYRCAATASDRFVSILPMCRATATTAACASEWGLFCRRLQGPGERVLSLLSEGPSKRPFHHRAGEGAPSGPDRASLERAVEAIVRTWIDELGDELARNLDPAAARALFERYRDAFSQGYREAYPPAAAATDVRLIEGLSPARPLGVDFHRRFDAQNADKDNVVGLKVWSHARPIPLSERVPVLENMGFKVVDERTYQIVRNAPDAADVWFHDMLLERADGGAVDLDTHKRAPRGRFPRGDARRRRERRLQRAGARGPLMWREVALLARHLAFPAANPGAHSQDYMWATLVKHAVIAADIVRLFAMRFDPRLSISPDERRNREGEIAAAIEDTLRGVQSLDEDRIIRHFVNAVQAAIRTDFYQIDAEGQAKQLIAVKLASRRLDGLPLPKPLYEIFVYSPRVEGVHLRFGKVARGGIRWSDRRQDFRTEILGLVKAQQVKNAVIVPSAPRAASCRSLPRHDHHRRNARHDSGRGHCRLPKLFISPCSTSPTMSSTTARRCARQWLRHDDDVPISWSPRTRARRRSPLWQCDCAGAWLLGGRCLRFRRLGRL
jgi:glutamate dehydrogenase